MKYTRRMAGIDANYVGAETETYLQANKFASELLASTWIALIEDIATPVAAAALHESLLVKGIIPVIRQCSEDADKLIHHEQPSDLGIILSKDLDLSDALQVLRFPKRFSPQFAEGIHRETLRAFLDRNNLDKLSDRRGYPQFLIRGLKNEIATYLDGLVYHDPYSEYYYSRGYYSSGTVAEMLGKCTAKKTKQWNLPYFGSPFYPSLRLTDARVDRWIASVDHQCYLSSTLGYNGSEVQIVNKSYKSGRVIAKENVTRAYYMQGFRRDIQDCLENNGYEYLMPSKHQEFNQMLAHMGSEGYDFCTVDLSMASDSIPAGLIREIFPTKFCQVWDELRSDYFHINGKNYLCFMANTSGSPLCFDMEKIFFYAIARLATDYSAAMGGYPPAMVTAMGDDIIIPSYAWDTLLDFLTMCGIVMNTSKSFNSDSLYRESCGYEAYDGYTTTTCYFPRKTITKTMDSLDSIRSLHNELFLKGYFKAALYCKDVITGLLGRPMTTSTIEQYVEYGYVPDCLGFVENARQITNDGLVCPGQSSLSHDCIVQKAVKRLPSNKAYEMYQYTQYLIHGPLYLTPLDEILGVSESRLRVQDLEENFSSSVKGDGGRSYI